MSTRRKLVVLLLLSESLSLVSSFLMRGPGTWAFSPVSSTSTAIWYGFDAYRSDDMSPARKQRIARENAIKKRYASGEELKSLRNDMDQLRENLKWATAIKDHKRVEDLSIAIAEGESRDPELVYEKTLTALRELEQSNRNKDKEKVALRWKKLAEEARSCIAYFQLEGLWVGNYGDHGYEMINVTYSGDNLVATKVTGDKNVPRGAISFTANLSPLNQSSADLAPIELSEESANKWGMKKVSRFAGQGQIAKEGFSDSKFVDGQLIMFENNFSFVWLPTRHHVFFGRPSPEVTIRMLRDTISRQDELENMRSHLEQCMDMDMTTCIARSFSDSKEPFRRILRESDLQEMEQKSCGTLEPKVQSFPKLFNVQMWKNYINDVLSDDSKKKDSA